jgi:hypothetical protein
MPSSGSGIALFGTHMPDLHRPRRDGPRNRADSHDPFPPGALGEMCRMFGERARAGSARQA